MKAFVDGDWKDVSLPTGFRAEKDAIVLEPKDFRQMLSLSDRGLRTFLGQLEARMPSNRGYLEDTSPRRSLSFSESSDEEAELKAALGVLLDHVDYENGACRVNEQVGAVLPREVLSLVRKAVKP